MTASSKLRRAAIAAAVGVLAMAVWPAEARADTVWQPSDWNGYRIYLSRACHDRGTGHCNPNYGCQGWNENVGSAFIASSATIGDGSDLIDRHYMVRIGDGLTSQNIANSNAWGSHLHIPVHTNATSATPCFSSTDASTRGTEAIYVSTSGFGCSWHLVDWVGDHSPGTRDRAYEDVRGLGELNQTTATACYLEAEYHTWNPGVNWLEGYSAWTWRIGAAVDNHFGYPR